MDARTPAWIGTVALSLLWHAALPVWADQAGDQYAVAASHYAARRWDLAATEFRAFIEGYPQAPRLADARYYLAECLLQSAKYREAAQTLEQCLQDQPGGKRARIALFRQGEAWHLAGDPKAAEPVLRRFIEVYNDDPSVTRALCYHGASLLALEQPAAAAEQFGQALRRGATGSLEEMCRLGKGQAAEQLKQNDEAAQWYQALLTAKTARVAQQARLRLGALQFRRGQFASAVATLKVLTELPPEDPKCDEARYWTALSLLQAGLHQPALEILLPWTEQPGPRTDEARYRAGAALIELGRPEDAEVLLEEVAADGPWGDAALSGRIQIAAAQENDADVEDLHQEFSRCYPQSPRSSEVAEIVARRLAATGKHAKAIQLLRSRLGEGPKDDDGDRRRRYLLALSYVGQQQHDEALRQLDLVLQTSDRELKRRTLQSQGAILVSQARYKEAIAPLASSLELQSGGAEAAICRGNLAICYARTGRIAEAKQLDRDLQTLPLDAARGLSTLALADAAAEAEERAWAETLWRRVADSDGPEAHRVQALYGLARSQLLAGEAADARDTCQRLLDLAPKGPLAAQAQVLHAAAFEKLGRQEEALRAYRSVADQKKCSLAAAALAKAAQLEHSLGRPDEAIALYQRLAREFPQSVEADGALYQAAWLLQGAQREDESLACFAKLNQHYPASRYWADATYRLAAAALKGGQHDAVRCLVASLTEADNTPPQVLAHGLLLDVQRGVAEGNWTAVEASAGELIQRAPQSKLAPVAEFWRAEAAYRQQQTDEAVRRFMSLEQRHLEGKDAWLAMVPLRLGQLAAAARDWSTARKRVEEVRLRWPSGDHLQELDYLWGRCLAAEARFDEARQAYTRVTEAGGQTKTETAAMAQWMIGETYLHQKRHDEALREYLRVEALYAYPRWQAAALLEAGRCYEAAGRPADAAAAYQRILEKYPETSYCEEARKRLQTSAAAQSPQNNSADASAASSNQTPPSAPREAAVPSNSQPRK